MNMILCSEPCIHQHDGCCALDGAGMITNAAISPCRYFSPLDITAYPTGSFIKKENKYEPDKNN